MVYYRKYRPQKIAELDNAAVREKLYAVLAKDTSHAFLFTGPKGLGKTSTARIIAKVVNCQRIAFRKLASSSKNEKLNAKRYSLDAEIEPCNQCQQCITITNGTNLDVLEIDGASNRGIDEIRDLRDKIRLAPFSAKKKIYIIDEVHMLTTEAFNALLKTLEEPPSHVLFILCTTEQHKVPQTIVSRCLQIVFSRATDEELVRSFDRIIKGEKLAAEKDALFTIAKLSDGSFRDGAKILEELVALSNGQKITKELVEKKYQVASSAHFVLQMLENLAEKDVKKSLGLVNTLSEQGIDIKYFIEQLLGTMHTELHAFFSGVSDTKFSIDEIKKLVELLTRAHQETKYAVVPQLPLELVIIDFCSVPSQPEVEKASRISSNTSKDTYMPVINATTSENATVSDSQKDFWYKFIDAVKVHNQSVAGLLRGCKIKSFDEKTIILETPYKFHKEKLEEKKTIEIIEKTVKEITEKTISASIVLKQI